MLNKKIYKNIFFIHGFMTNPKLSNKVKVMNRFFKSINNIDPKINALDINIEPKQSITDIESAILHYKPEDVLLVGSSLGGFYSYHISLKHNIKCLLINPSMKPFITLKEFIGKQKIIGSKDTFIWKKEYIEQLKDIYISNKHYIHKYKNYSLLLGEHDERLDYISTMHFFYKSNIKVLPTNHRFELLNEALEIKDISNLFYI